MRDHDVSELTARELERARRELAASLALARPDSPARAPILAHLAAIDTELTRQTAGRPGQLPATPPRTRPDPMTSFPPPEDTARITSILPHHPRWSIFWDKRHGLWRAAEDDPDSDLYTESRDADTVISYITTHSQDTSHSPPPGL